MCSRSPMRRGSQRFHLVGESIGGTIGLAATLARPERIATLTVSNGGHLGASIQRVNEWRRQLDELGVKGWSDIFMRGRFHDDALSPERWRLVRRAAGSLDAGFDPQRARRAGRHRSFAASRPDWLPGAPASSRRQSLHPGTGRGRNAPAFAQCAAQRLRPCAAWAALFPRAAMRSASPLFPRRDASVIIPGVMEGMR